jgi:hypothetical protein
LDIEAVKREKELRRAYGWNADTSNNFMTDPDSLAVRLHDVANYWAATENTHKHTATCTKYSLKKAEMEGRKVKNQDLICRFGCPWPLVKETVITEEGVLRLCRNHVRIVRYSPMLMAALQHNIDFAFIPGKVRTLATIYYITNYATKVETPAYTRLAWLAQKAKKEEDAGRYPGGSNELNPDFRKFMAKAADYISGSRTIFGVEVAARLLRQPTFYSNVNGWVNLNVYIMILRLAGEWPWLRNYLECNDSTYRPYKPSQPKKGRTPFHLDVYPVRGRALQNVCLYEYASFVQLFCKPRHLPCEKAEEFPLDVSEELYYEKFYQGLSSSYAVPVIDGFIQTRLSKDKNDRDSFK